MRLDRRMHVLVVLLLAAFVLQTAILRGHIHVGQAASASLELAAGTAPGGKQTPAHNEADCPLWHAAANCSAGLLTEAAPRAFPPVANKAPRDERTISPERFAAAWRSRAPPTL